MKEARSAAGGRLDAGRLGHDAEPEAVCLQRRPLRRGPGRPRYRGSLVTGWETVVNVDGGLSIT